MEGMEGPELFAYALVVCRDDRTGKFLMVQEFGASGWWLPGGRIDPGRWGRMIDAGGVHALRVGGR